MRVLVIAAAFGIFLVHNCAHTAPVMQFSNPQDVTIADPSVLKDGTSYYLYGTTDSENGFEVWSSADLVNWRRHGYCFRKTDTSWAQGYFWAPEVIKKAGTYYLYYTGSNANRLQVCVATSTSPLGMFTDLKAPMIGASVNCFDPSPFYDASSGNYYIYYTKDTTQSGSEYSELWGGRLNSAMTGFAEGPVKLLQGDSDWEMTPNGKLFIEGPNVMKYGQWYYMQFSGSSWSTNSYGLGCATAAQPLGPFVKDAANPFVHSNDSVFGPGHGCFVDSPNLADRFLVYHTHVTSTTWMRQLAIDRLDFQPQASGPPRLELPQGPTTSLQDLPAGAIPCETGRSDFFELPIDRNYWHIFNEYQEQWSQLGGRLGIECYGEMWGNSRWDARNVFLQYAPADNFSVEAAMDFSAERDTDSAGLIVFQDQANYAEVAGIQYYGLPYLRIVLYTNGNSSGELIQNPLSGRRLWLRIEVKHGDCSMFYSADGSVWTQAGPNLHLDCAGPVQAGLCAFSADLTAEPRCIAFFDDFRLEPLPSVSDLSVVATASPDPVGNGQPLNYTVGITNMGPDPATDVILTNTLPSRAQLVGSSGGCSAVGGVVECNLGALASSESTTVTLQVTPFEAGTAVSQVVIGSVESDYNPHNNTAVVVTEVLPVADLSLDVTHTPDDPKTGQELTYVLLITNGGPDEATSVTVTSSLPDSTSFVSAVSPAGVCRETSGGVECAIDSIPAGATANVNITVIPHECGVAASYAWVGGAEADYFPADNSADLNTLVRVAVVGDSVFSDDAFTTDVTNFVPGGTTGWTPLGLFEPGAIVGDYDADSFALRIRVSETSPTRTRIAGWYTGDSERLPCAAVGSGDFIRATFRVFSKGQSTPGDLYQVPNLRMRVSARFAVSSILEVFGHLAADPAGTLLGGELRPSAAPTSPSLYRVDFAPIDVPAMQDPGEGYSRGIEAYCLEPQEQGDLELAESSIGFYPAGCLVSTPGEPKIYATGVSDAGDLRVVNSLTDLHIATYNLDWSPDETPTGVPLYVEGPDGITMDSSPVPTDRFGIIVREFDPGDVLSRRIRVSEARQYAIRWHVLSPTNANLNPQLRLRARALKFMWSQKLELGGAYATNGRTALIASQVLPGTGCLNPDQVTAGEPGGWYTLLVHTPMSVDIRSDMTGPIGERMPAIAALPGPGDATDSARDLRVGMDLVDTVSGGSLKHMESGAYRLDRIEIHEYELIGE